MNRAKDMKLIGLARQLRDESKGPFNTHPISKGRLGDELAKVPPQAWEALSLMSMRPGIFVERNSSWCAFELDRSVNQTVVVRIGEDRSAEAWGFRNILLNDQNNRPLLDLTAGGNASVSHTGVGRVLSSGLGANLGRLMHDRLGMTQAFSIANHTFPDPVLVLGDAWTRKAEQRQVRLSKKKRASFHEALVAIAILCALEPTRRVEENSFFDGPGGREVLGCVGRPADVAANIVACFAGGPRLQEFTERLLRPSLPYVTRLYAGLADSPMMVSQHERDAAKVHFVDAILAVKHAPTAHERLSARSLADGILRKQRLKDAEIAALIDGARRTGAS